MNDNQASYDMVNLKDPEEPEPIAADKFFPKEKVEKEAIEVVPISAEELAKQQKKNAEQRALEEKQEKEKLKREKSTIFNRKKQTSIELARREKEIEQIIKNKQDRSEKEFNMKKEVLQTSFRASVDSLIKRVKKQKDIITSSYGPIVLNSKKIEKPIFDINPELDPDGHALMKRLNDQQDVIPQTILVKLRTVRCLKDKISSGHYLLLVHPLDRLGGNKIPVQPGLTKDKYVTLSKHLRDFAVMKRQFLNTENRLVVQ